LTFDDGPSEFTPHLLDILKKSNVKATFCVTGAHVEKYPQFVQRAHKEGHQIAIHTYSHPHLMSLSNEDIIYEVKATEAAIVKAIGVRPRYLRPPFGEADARVKALAKAMDYKILMWNVDPRDYDVFFKHQSGTRITKSLKKVMVSRKSELNAHNDPGFISLQHGK
jgi:peptidoglycan/xylan/chitin deacetylase (PgdA/CDA1 family)